MVSRAIYRVARPRPEGVSKCRMSCTGSPASPASLRTAASASATTRTRCLRKLRGLTQAQVADRAGVSTNTVRRLEGADGGIALENSLRIFRALGILESVPRAPDPYETDVGRLRSDEKLPQRVRPKNLTNG
jgi:DNA-binding XRE family transcriptional regulator